MEVRPLKNAFSALATPFLFLFAFSMIPAVSVSQEETVESLKKQLAGLEKKFGAVTKDRDGLYEQLLASIEEIEALESGGEAAQLKVKLDQVTTGRDYLANRLREKIAEFSGENKSLQGKLAAVTTGRDYLTARLKAKITESADAQESLQAELESEQNSNDFLGNRIRELQAQSKSASAAHQSEVAKLESDSDALAEVALVQIKSALAERNAAREALAASESANAKQAADMESVINGRSYIEKQLGNANTTIAALQEELKGLKADSMEASGDAGDSWGADVAASLEDRLSGIDGLEVSDLGDNRVNIRVGASGLFRSGGKELSNDGRSMVDLVGYALLDHPDAKILVSGHTDSVPVGSDSPYADNEDLSNQRALEAMNQLGSLGLPFSQMSSAGMGASSPLASNDTAEGRSLNRRVEITVSQQ